MHSRMHDGESRRDRRPSRLFGAAGSVKNIISLRTIALACISMGNLAAAFVTYSPSASSISLIVQPRLVAYSPGMARKQLHPTRFLSREHRPLCAVRTVMGSSASDSSGDKKSGNGLTKLKEESVRLFSKLLANLATLIR